MRILVINPGATSTKVAVYSEHGAVHQAVIDHAYDAIRAFRHVNDQIEYRLGAITDWLRSVGVNLDELDGFSGRGGLIRHVESGTYEVNDAAVADALSSSRQHPANLGIVLAARLAAQCGKKAFFTDPVSTDEWPDFVHLSGFAPVDRACYFHALNQKAMAKKAAKILDIPYENARLIVIHMGGGISVGAHLAGRVVDVFNVMDEGGFSLNRSGSIPVAGLVSYCFSGLPEAEVKRQIQTRGGFLSYLDTQDFREIEARLKSEDKKAGQVYAAFIWQLTKDVGAMAAVMSFRVDGVVLTGGMAHSDMLRQNLTERLENLAPIIPLPGECEMEALAEGALDALKYGAKTYDS